MPTAEITSVIERVGKFRIKREITEGQNSYAFIAHHIHLNRDAFLKVCPYSEHIAGDVLREPRTLVDAMRAFRCENVVELYDAETVMIGSCKFLCLQMEFVQGDSLLAQMRKGEIGQQDAVRLIVLVST